MVHWPDAETDIRKTMEVLSKAKEEGKIRYIGLCNSNNDDIKKASEITKVDILQSEFNYFNRSVQELIAKEHLESKAFMSWGTLDKGILTGKHKKNQHYDESDCRRGAPWWKKSVVDERIDEVERLKPIINEKNHEMIEFAIGYNLSQPFLDTVLIGSKSKKQLESTMKAYENKMSAEDIRKIL